ARSSATIMLYSTCASTTFDDGEPKPEQPPIASALDASAASRKILRIIAARPVQRACRRRSPDNRRDRDGARVEVDAAGVGPHTIRKSESLRRAAVLLQPGVRSALHRQRRRSVDL